jgi:hypothetical protein
MNKKSKLVWLLLQSRSKLKSSPPDWQRSSHAGWLLLQLRMRPKRLPLLKSLLRLHRHRAQMLVQVLAILVVRTRVAAAEF